MGRFWGRSSAFAFGISFVLAAGLLLSCDLNPQPAPPARQEGATGGASGSPATTTAANSGTTGAISQSTSTAGEPIHSGNTSSSGGSMEPDGEGPESPATQTSTGGAMQGEGGAGGAAGAPDDEEAPAGAANTPR